MISMIRSLRRGAATIPQMSQITEVTHLRQGYLTLCNICVCQTGWQLRALASALSSPGLREGLRAASTPRVHEAQSQASELHLPKESRHSEERAGKVYPQTGKEDYLK
jgi:hypothetical protein